MYYFQVSSFINSRIYFLTKSNWKDFNNNDDNNNKKTSQKINFSIKDFLSKCDQVSRKLPIWSFLLKKSLNVQLCRFENLPISLSSHEYNMAKISH